MPLLVGLVLAFAPGIFWLWYFYHKDVYQPEPRRLVLKTFLLGLLVVVPVGLVEWVLLSAVGLQAAEDSGDLLGGLTAMVLVVGPVEEVAKYLAVRWAVLRSPHFDEPADGLVYASAAALGFASLENLGYMASFGWEVVLVRGPISTLGHVLFSGLWGYALGRALVQPEMRRQLPFWLAGSALAHGLFNTLLFAFSPWGLLLNLALFALLARLLWRRLAWAQQVSPFKRDALRVYGRCPGCGRRVRPGSARCPACRRDLAQEG